MTQRKSEKIHSVTQPDIVSPKFQTVANCWTCLKMSRHLLILECLRNFLVCDVLADRQFLGLIRILLLLQESFVIIKLMSLNFTIWFIRSEMIRRTAMQKIRSCQLDWLTSIVYCKGGKNSQGGVYACCIHFQKFLLK